MTVLDMTEDDRSVPLELDNLVWVWYAIFRGRFDPDWPAKAGYQPIVNFQLIFLFFHSRWRLGQNLQKTK